MTILLVDIVNVSFDKILFKRRLVAFKGGFVGPSVGLSVLKKKSKSFEKEVL